MKRREAVAYLLTDTVVVVLLAFAFYVGTIGLPHLLVGIAALFSSISATYYWFRTRAKKTEVERILIEKIEKRKRIPEPPLAFSTYASPKLYVDTDVLKKVERYISTYSGGNIGITGKRGAGKTSLLLKILHIFTSKPRLRCLTVYIPSPTSYEEKEFLINVFKTILLNARETILERTESRLKTRFPVSKHLRKVLPDSQAARKTVSSFILGLIALGLALLLSSIAQVLAAAIAIVLISSGFLRVYFPSEFDRLIKHLHRQFPQEYNVYLSASALLERIDYEQTYKTSASIETSISESLKGIFGFEKEITHRPYTLPELVDNYRSFVELLTERHSESENQSAFDKVIIAVDELDKISNKEQSLGMLRKLKAVLSIPNCYYLISVAEECARDFNVRGLGGLRDEVESSFDLVLKVGPVSLAVMEEIIRKRYVSNPLEKRTLWLACLTSGGIPREALKTIQNWNLSELTAKRSGARAREIMKLMTNEKLSSVINEILISRIDDSLKDEIIETLSDLKHSDKITSSDLDKINGFSKIARNSSKKNENVALSNIISKLEIQLRLFRVIGKTVSSKHIRRTHVERLYHIGAVLNENRSKARSMIDEIQ